VFPILLLVFPILLLAVPILLLVVPILFRIALYPCMVELKEILLRPHAPFLTEANEPPSYRRKPYQDSVPLGRETG